MTKGELKKLNRAELLAMLMSVTQRCDDLEEELAEVTQQLKDRSVDIGKSGTMAEAMLRINGVMEAVDRAGAQYLENLKKMSEESAVNASIDSIALSEESIEETREKCKAIEEETKQRCVSMVEKAQTESQAYWDEVYSRIVKYSETIESLKDFINRVSPETK